MRRVDLDGPRAGAPCHRSLGVRMDHLVSGCDRLREFYLAVAPELAPYLLVVRAAPADPAMPDARLGPRNWQLMLTTAGIVAVVNSIVVGVIAGLLLTNLARASLAVKLSTGAIVGAAALVMHRIHHRSALDAYTAEEIDQAAIVAPVARPAERR
jgi:hypothetical protein